MKSKYSSFVRFFYFTEWIFLKIQSDIFIKYGMTDIKVLDGLFGIKIRPTSKGIPNRRNICYDFPKR